MLPTGQRVEYQLMIESTEAIAMIVDVGGGLLIAALVSVALTALVRRGALRRRALQPICEDVPDHASKSGTPTMGGVGIVGAVVTAYWLIHLVSWSAPSAVGIALTGLLCATSAIGLIDDLTKVRRGRNAGLSASAKAAGLAVVGGVFGLALVALGVTSRLSASLYGLGAVRLGGFALVIWSLVLVLATSNAVNLTDGMDGLASGASTLVFSGYAAVAVWMALHPAYGVADAGDIAVVAGAAAGASVGFLVWNAHPARIFMGDTGSLAIGGLLAGVAVTTGSGLMLPVIGVLFVLEALSVIVLVASFRTSGRRPFHAPIHHQFQSVGWSEPRVVGRLLMVSGLGVVTFLAVVAGDWAVGSQLGRLH